MSSGATDEHRPETIVVGLGNPILGDDGVGWHVIDALAERLENDREAAHLTREIELDRLAVGGLSLMERIVGYRRAVIIDADVETAPGQIRVGPPSDFDGRAAAHTDSAHDMTLSLAIDMARGLSSDVPGTITVVAIGIVRADQFCESMSPAVAAAVEPAVGAVLEALAVPASVGAV